MRSAVPVFWAFLRLGLTSFGGPIAHIGYFRRAFVERLGWLDEAAFGELLALCQALPGPASSQLGFAIGLRRAGLVGGLAAWLGFTLPSALILTLCAPLLLGAADHRWGAGLLHGLKLVAVPVVAQAIWGMRRLCPDAPRIGIAAISLGVILVLPPASGQIAAILVGGLLGLALIPAGSDPMTSEMASMSASRRSGLGWLLLFAALLLVPPHLPQAAAGAVAVFDAFYRSGALVFGGGHVVLPLLQQAVVVPGWVSQSDFLAGYGAAQAVPGPLFTVAAFLGATMRPGPGGIAGAVLPLVAIFLPGLLLILGIMPYWHALRRQGRFRSALAGANAAVLGLLLAALYTPVWRSAVLGFWDAAAVVAGLALLMMRLPPLALVLIMAAYGIARAALSGFP